MPTTEATAETTPHVPVPTSETPDLTTTPSSTQMPTEMASPDSTLTPDANTTPGSVTATTSSTPNTEKPGNTAEGKTENKRSIVLSMTVLATFVLPSISTE